MEPWTNLIFIMIHLLETLEQFLPLLVVVYTNFFVIIAAVFVLTIGQRFTSFQSYVDDDIRFLTEDDRVIEENKKTMRNSRTTRIVQKSEEESLSLVKKLVKGSGVNNVVGHHVYMVRIYFLNYWQLDDLLPEAINESGEIEAAAETTVSEWDTLLIELLDATRCHITRLQLDFQFLRSSYRNKFEARTKSIQNMSRKRELDKLEKKALKVNGNVFYQVKFLFERATPLKNVHFARVRKLSNAYPVVLYRIEISNCKDPSEAFVSDTHIHRAIEQSSQFYPMIKLDHYTPEPYDRSFNPTKVIWTEMCLAFLSGIDILTIVSLSMLHYFENKSHFDSKEMLWTLTFLGTLLAALVSFNVLLYYRVATNHFPAWRRRIQGTFHWILTAVVVVLGLAGVYAAFQSTLITKFKQLRFWIRGYFMALLFYTLIFLGAILIDFFFLYKI